jgi:GNAT superfamily N-acetyltransferase
VSLSNAKPRRQRQKDSTVPQTQLLRPMTAADIPVVIDIGRRIWLEHYVPIIGPEQVAYMLAQRFTPDHLGQYLEVDGNAAGYCSHSLGPEASSLKLEQLYLLPRLHGHGLGRLMMSHVEQHARTLHCSILWLTVNKHNEGSIAFYRKSGFRIREAAVFDIGNGFVMDDFVMEKTL